MSRACRHILEAVQLGRRRDADGGPPAFPVVPQPGSRAQAFESRPSGVREAPPVEARGRYAAASPRGAVFLLRPGPILWRGRWFRCARVRALGAPHDAEARHTASRASTGGARAAAIRDARLPGPLASGAGQSNKARSPYAASP